MNWIRETIRPIALGDWTIEMRDDDLAGVAYRGREVLRSVRAVVRDRDWATAAWDVVSVEAEGTEATANSTGRASRDARVVLRSGSFGADLRAVVSLAARGPALTVAAEVTTAREFETNRTGLVVLHPPSLAGAAVTVGHSSGDTSETVFPRDISPHQPAFDIVSLESCGVRVEFSGDTFEMEDQRNWTDASFKTYSRPLSLPFPYVLGAGETVRQSVTVTIGDDFDPEGMTFRRENEESAEVARCSAKSHRLGDLEFAESGPMPEVSVGASTAPGEAPAADPIGSTLLVELDLGWPGWRAAFDRAVSSGLPLDIRLVLPETDPGAAVMDAVRSFAPYRLARVAAFQPAGHDAEHVSDIAATEILRRSLDAAGISVPVVGGARSHFTELNRERRRLPEGLEGVVFSTTPLFHTLETRQLEEAIAMQRVVSEQAVRIAGGKPVHVGPITLRAHVNNVATTAPPRPTANDLSEGYGPELLSADDARHTAPELAAWTIASAAALTVPGIASLSFFEEWGPRGIRAADGSDHPVADALRALAELEGPIETASTADGRVWAIRSPEMTLVANLGDSERSVGGFAVPSRAWRAMRSA